MEFKDVYCSTCKKNLGRYNMKYFSDEKLDAIIANNHAQHIREGHSVIILRQ